MNDPRTLDPVLPRFRAALAEIYGERLARVVLFGSRARGDARPDSDYDVAVFLNDLPDPWAERHRLADLRVRFLDETDAFIDAKPYLMTAYRDTTPLMHEIRKDGLELPLARGDVVPSAYFAARCSGRAFDPSVDIDAKQVVCPATELPPPVFL